MQLMHLLRYNYIKKEDENNVRTHKYHGSDSSYIAEYILFPMAEFLIKYTPEWLAPNTITVIGLICNLLPCLYLMLFYYQKEVPQYLVFITAFLQLMYINLDNMDGKQARKTGNSTPLGILFDHGCDALNISIISINVAIILRLTPIQLVFSVVGMTLPFYFNILEEYHLQKLAFPVINATSDGNVYIFLQYMVTVYFGKIYTFAILEIQKELIFGQLKTNKLV